MSGEDTKIGLLEKFFLLNNLQFYVKNTITSFIKLLYLVFSKYV